MASWPSRKSLKQPVDADRGIVRPKSLDIAGKASGNGFGAAALSLLVGGSYDVRFPPGTPGCAASLVLHAN